MISISSNVFSLFNEESAVSMASGLSFDGALRFTGSASSASGLSVTPAYFGFTVIAISPLGA